VQVPANRIWLTISRVNSADFLETFDYYEKVQPSLYGSHPRFFIVPAQNKALSDPAVCDEATNFEVMRAAK